MTCIKWNPHYSDLCAVGFGSYDFMRQGTGVICSLEVMSFSFNFYCEVLEGDLTTAHIYICQPLAAVLGQNGGKTPHSYASASS